MIETHLLEALVAFDSNGTLLKASEKLHISQPALTRSMKKIEDIFGVKLFKRSANHLELNECGKMAAHYAKEILNMQEKMLENVRNYDLSLHTISIGSSIPGPLMELPGILSRIYANTTISYTMDNEDSLLKELHNKKYSFIITARKYEIETCYTQYYGSEKLYLSLIPAHPACVYKDAGVYFKDMNGETFLMGSYVGIWEKLVKEMMPDSKFILQSDRESLDTVINSSSLNAFATDLTIRLYRGNSDLKRVFVPFKDKEAKMDYYFICLKENKEKLSSLLSFMNNIHPD